MEFGTEWLNLGDDERLIIHTHPSKYTLINKLLGALFMAANLVFLLFSKYTEGVEIFGFNLRLLILLSLPLCFVPILIAQIRRLSTHYVVTDKNLWAKKKIYARDVDPVLISRIQDVNYSQGMIDRALNKGEIRIETAGTGGTDVVMREVPRPNKVTAIIRENMQQFDSPTLGNQTHPPRRA